MAELQSVWFSTAHLQFTGNIPLLNPEPFAREGFEVFGMHPGVGDMVVRTLVEHRAEYCNVLGYPLSRAVSGFPMKFVLSYQDTGWELWTRPGIETLQDLEGKTLGRSSPFPKARLHDALQQAGVDPASVAEGPMVPLDAAGMQDVADGLVDAVLVMAPVSAMAKQAGLLSTIDLNPLGPSGAYGLMTTDRMLGERRDEVKRFARALLRSTRQLQENRDLAFSLVERQEVPRRYIDQALDATLPYLNTGGELTEESQRYLIEAAKGLLKLDEPVPLERAFDFSLVREIKQEEAAS